MIEAKSLTKDYGTLRAVENFDLKLDRGDIFGFIGPNGSGKTTTLRMLATLLNPTAGEAWIGGLSVRHNARDVRRLIGYMPDVLGTYEDMRVDEFLAFFCAAYDIRGARCRARMQEVLDRVSLADQMRQSIATLSRGMSQRLSMARVLLHDPDVLLLDEPLSGLDPVGRADIRTLWKELQHAGKTIVVSSHILSELAGTCNRVGMIDKGRLKLDSSMNEIAQHSHSLKVLGIEIVGSSRTAADVLSQLDGIEEVAIKDGCLRVTLRAETDGHGFISSALVEAGFPLLSLNRVEEDLESVFLRVMQDDLHETSGAELPE